MVQSSVGRIVGMAILPLALLLGACSSDSGGDHMMSMAPKPSLYDRLGGKPAITAVVDDFVGNVAADGRINQRFAHAESRI